MPLIRKKGGQKMTLPWDQGRSGDVSTSKACATAIRAQGSRPSATERTEDANANPRPQGTWTFESALLSGKARGLCRDHLLLSEIVRIHAFCRPQWRSLKMRSPRTFLERFCDTVSIVRVPDCWAASSLPWSCGRIQSNWARALSGRNLGVVQSWVESRRRGLDFRR